MSKIDKLIEANLMVVNENREKHHNSCPMCEAGKFGGYRIKEEKNEWLDDSSSNLGVTIQNKMLSLSLGNTSAMVFKLLKINYCPICGRKLNV